jgi:hypothetical protein
VPVVEIISIEMNTVEINGLNPLEYPDVKNAFKREWEGTEKDLIQLDPTMQPMFITLILIVLIKRGHLDIAVIVTILGDNELDKYAL